jgi:mycofactocin precursor
MFRTCPSERAEWFIRGGTVVPETLLIDEAPVEIGEVEELLVEEVSIDGLCGVY